MKELRDNCKHQHVRIRSNKRSYAYEGDEIFDDYVIMNEKLESETIKNLMPNFDSGIHSTLTVIVTLNSLWKYAQFAERRIRRKRLSGRFEFLRRIIPKAIMRAS